MDIIPQRPSIQNVAGFVRDLAAALEQLHNDQRAHGGLASSAIIHWLNDTKDALDSKRFRDLAKPGAHLTESSQTADVHAFALCCISMISGAPSVPGAPFRAELYRGGEWSFDFLKLLETISNQTSNKMVSISQLNQALNSNSAPIATVNDPTNAIEPTVASAPTSISAAQTKPIAPIPPVISVVLRNATVGKLYKVEPGAIATAIANQRGDIPENARIAHLDLPKDCGLVFDEITGAVNGTPTIPFDGFIYLDYSPSPNEGSFRCKVSFLINPDPASLWKDLPPPIGAPYQKPLLDHREEHHGLFRVVAASRRGRSHANKGEFRDDDFAVGYAQHSGWLVIVVADGAGSASYSRRGSQIACAAAKDRITTILNSPQHNQAEALYAKHLDWRHPDISKALRHLLYESALDAHHKLRTEVARPAEVLPSPPVLRNFDTTLIILVMKKVDDGCIVATFAIGDGGGGLLTNAEEGFPITKPEGGDYAGQTCFLTMPETLKNDEASIENRFQFILSKEFCAAFAMTDGITDPKFPSDAAYTDSKQWAAFYAELKPALTSSIELLEWMNFMSPGNHDDRTLVAVLPAQPVPSAVP